MSDQGDDLVGGSLLRRAAVATDVSVTSGESTSLQPSGMSVPTAPSVLKGDINDDGRIGLEEAINALKVLSRIE